MKQYAESGRVGVCHKLRRDDIYAKSFAGGYPYIESGQVVRSSQSRPIYSYAKNYTKDNKDFALFVWTIDSDVKSVEALLDDHYESVTSESIDQGTADGSFVYVD